MNWRQARDVRDNYQVKERVFDELSRGAVPPVSIVATPVQYIDSYYTWHKGQWGMVVSRDALRVGKKSMGSTRVEIDIPLDQVRSARVLLQGGHGPLYELEVTPGRGGVVHILFRDLDTASAVFDAIQQSLNQAPAGTPGNSDGGEPTVLVDQIRSVMADLKGMPTLMSPRSPFGEGSGLEQAMACLGAHFSYAGEIRQAGHMMGVTFLTAPDLGPEVLYDVMGATRGDDVATAGDEGQAAVDSLAGACTSFLGQFDEPGKNIWDLWLRNDEVAAEFLSWFCVAQLRLHSLGRMEDPLS